MKLDTAGPDNLLAVYQPYKVGILQHLMEIRPGIASSQEVHTWLLKHGYTTSKTASKGVSRASVINALKELADDGLLTESEESCKGGSRRLYQAAHTNNPKLMNHIIAVFQRKLTAIGDHGARL